MKTQPTALEHILAVKERQAKKPVIPPDPDGFNNERADFAAKAVEAFRRATRTDEPEVIRDLLVNLAHLCDRKGIDLANELRIAGDDYGSETRGEGLQFDHIEIEPPSQPPQEPSADEYDALLDIQETECTLDCGCRMWRHQEYIGCIALKLCSAHQAPKDQETRLIFGEDVAASVVAHVVRSHASVNVDYQGCGAFQISVASEHKHLLPIQP